MKLKTAITLFIIILVFALVVVGYFLFFTGRDSGERTTSSNRLPENRFFPVENTGMNGETTPQNGTTTVEVSGSPNIPKLRQISSVPVAGFTTFDRILGTSTIVENIDGEEVERIETETETVFRYVERATGNIYEATSRKLMVDRITNTTVPKVYEAVFTNNGNSVILRYLDPENQIETFIADITVPGENEVEEGEESAEANLDESTLQTLSGTFLPKDVPTISVSPDGTQLFYLLSPEIGGSIGQVVELDSTNAPITVFTSDLSELNANWINSNSIYLNTKPSAKSEGFVYNLNPETGTFRKVLDNLMGLNIKVSPDEENIFISGSFQNSFGSGIVNFENNQTQNSVPFNSLSEKCVWSKLNSKTFYCASPAEIVPGLYPESWYMGLTSFTDRIIKMNLETNSAENIDGITQNFDIVYPQLTENEDYLVFINKKDLTLWSLDLK